MRDGLRQGQVGPGQRAILKRQATVLAQDRRCAQGEFGGIGSSNGHRVRDQKDPLWLGGHGDADGVGRDMDAVGDQADEGGAQKGRTDKAGFAPAKLAHGVEKMRDAARACGKGRVGGRSAEQSEWPRLTVMPARGHGGDLGGGDAFGGDGDHQRGQVFCAFTETVQVRIRHRADQARVMGALAARVQMRAFKVQADKAGNALIRRPRPPRPERRRWRRACR